MSDLDQSLLITAAALVNGEGLRSSAGIDIRWRDIDLDPVAGRVRTTPIFGTAWRDFRRLDILSKMLVVAAEACGLDQSLPETEREGTALVLASSTGCLAADQRFERSLHTPKGIEPAVFPYTLPSTCLGEIAIRHRLRGPTICLSVAAGEEGGGLEAAAGLLEDGEAPAVLVVLGDWAPGKTAAAVLLLRPGGADTPHLVAIDAISNAPLLSLEALL